MIRRKTSRSKRPELTLGLALAVVSGCATRSASVREPNAPEPNAPDLLNVSAVAPPINMGLARIKSPGPKAVEPIDKGVTPAAVAEPASKAETPATEVEPAAPVRAPSEEKSVGASLVPVNHEAGIMGPSPSITTTAEATPPSIPQAVAPYPIDLASALRLADGQNPTIGEARILIMGALAERLAARALLLPYLNAGTNYHDHTGPLQRSSGQILKLNEQSLYFGGGARTVAAESVSIPAVNIFSPLTDAIYEPLAAHQRVIGSRANASDTANKVLLEVASLYIDLIGAEAILQARRVTAAESDRIAASVAAYAETGQGRRSDASRADADRRLFQADIQKAEERVAVASALLAQRLNLDPSARLQPISGVLEPIDLINAETPTDELIRAAVIQRPDLASREALVSSAEYRIKQEKMRPLLPTIWLGFSGGAFGGGSSIVPGSTHGSFAGRTDFDVRAYWTVLNLGAGNASLIKRRKAEAGQALAERARVINEIRAEVTSRKAESLALRSQVTKARFGLRTAEDGYRQDQTRLRETLALPIEALDSLRLLSEARVALVETITRANRAQFALFVSLGAPPPLDAPPVAVPQPNAPPVPAVPPPPLGGA